MTDPWREGYKLDRDRQDRERANRGISSSGGSGGNGCKFLLGMMLLFVVLGIATMVCSWLLMSLD